jgi:hypothetical protein
MTWTEITLPYSETVIYDTAALDEFGYCTKGFSFTLTEPSSVVISGPQGLAYYKLFASQDMDSSLIAEAYTIYETLEAGTYYILTDDRGFGEAFNEPLQTRIEVYVANGQYQSYTEEALYSLLSTQSVGGDLQDTLLMFNTDFRIAHSTKDLHYIEVQEGKSYKIVGRFSSADSIEYGGGVCVLNSTLTGNVYDLACPQIEVTSEKPADSTIYTADQTGAIKILPYSYTNGISYEIFVEQLETYTVSEALDAAKTITDLLPYEQEGIMGEDALLINCQDGSLIGMFFLPNQLYFGHTFKTHLSKNDSLVVTANVDFFNDEDSIIYNVADIHIFEKSDNGYEKIGQVSASGEDTPPISIAYKAENDMDLYILASNIYYFIYSYIEDPGFTTDRPYELRIDRYTTSSSLENIYTTANIKITNPVKDFATIRESAGKNIEVYDNLGKCIFKQKITSDNEQIATNSWAKGIYFVKLTKDGMNLGTAKLIKI